MKIGLISDTHGYFDPKIHDIFAGVDHILHGGDIGFSSIVLELEDIAPVTAVLGNNDFGMTFQETEILELRGKKFLVHHIVQPARLQDPLKGRVERARPDVVVFGHTHQAFNQVIDGILYVNPGYAGKQRFRLERSVAVIELSDAGMNVDFVSL